MHLPAFVPVRRVFPSLPKVQLQRAGPQGRVAFCPGLSAGSSDGKKRFVVFSQSREVSGLSKSARSALGGVHTPGREQVASGRRPAVHFCRFFTSAVFLRRESRKKWMDAAQAAASENSEGAEGEAVKPQVFIVNGEEILLSTSPAIPGHSILQFKGLAEGSSVRGRSALEFWRQQLQQQLGGEQQLLSDLLRETRQLALQRLAEAAAAAGGNAVVSVRLVTSGLQRMHAEYTAYGTAVRVSKPP